MKRSLVPVIFLFLILQHNYIAQTTSSELITQLDSSLRILVDIQKKVIDIHPCLKELHPVAVPYHDSLLIFDYNSAGGEYNFVKETGQPFPLPEGIQASFPLSVYDNRPTCIVNPKTFGDPAGYSTVLHEFIHCCQYSSAEPEIKQSLDIYNSAMRNKDYSWEITHPFPYEDSVFIDYYDHFKTALEKNNTESAKLSRDKLKAYLSRPDFEYMLWEEWKEGLARYVENRINERLKIGRNDYGKDEPYNRVSFYYSGELLITMLVEADPGLAGDIKLLFIKMKEF